MIPCTLSHITTPYTHTHTHTHTCAPNRPTTRPPTQQGDPGQQCDAFLDGLNLLEYKAELEAITSKPWSITEMNWLDMDALAGTTMKPGEKNKLLQSLESAMI